MTEISVSRTGYAVEGWYTDDGERWDFTAPVTAPMTLTAKWEIATHNVTFSSNGNETTVGVTYGTSVEKPDVPVREGYIFAGWYWDSEFSRSGLYNFNEAVYRDFTLYAKWVENTATEGLEFQLADGGNYAYVVGYNGTAKDVVIPSTYQNMPVKYIWREAFRYSKIEFVYVPETVVQIKENAFYGSDLVCVVFANNSNLDLIEPYAFEDCELLGRVSFGENSKLREIKDWAFRYCDALYDITLPSGIEITSATAFEYCGAISRTEWGGAYYIGTEDNPYYYLLVAKNKEITELSVHDDTRVIAKFACMGCKSLKSITIPEGVKLIGLQAFDGCHAVTEIHYNAKNAADVESSSGTGVFNVGSKTAGAVLYIGGAVERIPANMFAFSGKIVDVVFLDAEFSTTNVLKSIGANAFRNCAHLTFFEVTTEVEEIGAGAFTGCVRLVHVMNNSWKANEIEIKAGTHDYGDIALNAILVTDGGKSAIVKTEDGFVFMRYGETYLVSYEGTEESVTLPKFYDLYETYTVRKHAFYNDQIVKTLVIPSTDMKLDASAFEGSAIESVTLPVGMSEIPDRCFANTKLKSITIVNTVKVIGESAFNSCALEEIIFESGCTLEEIGNEAFRYVRIARFVIPASVKRVGDNFISHSSGTNNQTVLFAENSQIEYVSNISFASCGENTVKVDDYGAKYVGSENNPNLVLLGFVGSAPKKYTVMNGARVIAYEKGSFSFYSVKEITLPATIVYVGYISAFSDNSSHTLNLADMQLLNRLIKSIEKNEGINRGILSGAVAINVGGAPLTDLVIEEGIGEIYAELFSRVESIQTVSFPSTLTKVGTNAFAGCKSIKELTLPQGLTSADFNSMIGLEKVYINSRNAKVYISQGAAEIIIGAGVESLGGAMVGAVKVSFANTATITKIGDGAFKDSKITSITLPASLKEIGASAFEGTTALQTATLPAELTAIGVNAFKGSGITEITIPAKVHTISSGAFASCFNLASVVISEGVKVIESEAFNKVGTAYTTTEVTMASTVVKIGANAFVASGKSSSYIRISAMPAGCYYLSVGAIGAGVTNRTQLLNSGYTWYYIDENGVERNPSNPESYAATYDLYRKNTTVTFVNEQGDAVGLAQISLCIDGVEEPVSFTTDYLGTITFSHSPIEEIKLVILSLPEGYEIPGEVIVLLGTESTVVLKAKA